MNRLLHFLDTLSTDDKEFLDYAEKMDRIYGDAPTEQGWKHIWAVLKYHFRTVWEGVYTLINDLVFTAAECWL